MCKCQFRVKSDSQAGNTARRDDRMSLPVLISTAADACPSTCPFCLYFVIFLLLFNSIICGQFNLFFYSGGQLVSCKASLAALRLYGFFCDIVMMMYYRKINMMMIMMICVLSALLSVVFLFLPDGLHGS